MHDSQLELNQCVYAQFRFWLGKSFPGYCPGEDVASMWKTLPFGAILPDSDWTWWSLERVTQGGVALANQLDCRGIVIADGLLGAAVLSWPDGARGGAQVRMVPFTGTTGASGERLGGGTSVIPKRFIAAKGFDDLDRVIACAVVSEKARTNRHVTASDRGTVVEAEDANTFLQRKRQRVSALGTTTCAN